MDFFRNGEREEEEEERVGGAGKWFEDGMSNMDLVGPAVWMGGGEREHFVDPSPNLSLFVDSLAVNTLVFDSDSKER